MDYTTATLKEIVDYVTDKNYVAVQRMKSYHRQQSNMKIAEKIDNALRLVRYFKLKQQLEDCEKELESLIEIYRSSTAS